MKGMLLCALVAMLMAVSVAADTHARLNIRMDTSHAGVSALGSTRAVSWSGGEGEVEVEWDKPKLIFSGWALGMRKEGQYHTDGTFFTLRTFGRIPLVGRRLAVHPSFGLVYGLAGPPMMRVFDDGAWVFPVHTVDIPGTEVKGDGILYPEFSVAVRLKLWRFTAEPVVGLRWIRFGTYSGDRYADGRVLTPTMGLRVGFVLASVK